MIDDESRKEELEKSIEIEEEVIRNTLKKMDISQLLINDYLTTEIELIPGKLSAKYKSPYDGEIFEIEEDANLLEIKDETLRELYRYRRSLAVSLISINDTEYMPGAGTAARVEGLKRKPKHIVDKLLWGYILFQESLNRLLSSSNELEEKTKNS